MIITSGKAYKTGIPIDSADNQLAMWILVCTTGESRIFRPA